MAPFQHPSSPYFPFPYPHFYPPFAYPQQQMSAQSVITRAESKVNCKPYEGSTNLSFFQTKFCDAAAVNKWVGPTAIQMLRMHVKGKAATALVHSWRGGQTST
jgi:hypothetical protein